MTLGFNHSWCCFDSPRQIIQQNTNKGLKLPKIDRSALRVMIGLRKYICSQFKPNVAKALYDLFKAKNIMDFSMGWGDRLAGFFASQNTELYVGVDPRKENHPIYREQADYYEGQLTMFETMKKVDFYRVAETLRWFIASNLRFLSLGLKARLEPI